LLGSEAAGDARGLNRSDRVDRKRHLNTRHAAERAHDVAEGPRRDIESADRRRQLALRRLATLGIGCFGRDEKNAAGEAGEGGKAGQNRPQDLIFYHDISSE
jgi:hypothetical protein